MFTCLDMLFIVIIKLDIININNLLMFIFDYIYKNKSNKQIYQLYLKKNIFKS